MNKNKPKLIIEVAKKTGIALKDIDLYGKYTAKVSLSAIKAERIKNSKYILTTAITPSPFGEGKTLTTIGASMALNKIGKKSSCCIRQPSMGPLLGIKGGGSGGGMSQVIPAEDFNLHMTGDSHAISIAHNLLSSFLDNHLYRGNSLGIDIKRINWKRTIDLNDIALRTIKVGIGLKCKDLPRISGFDITAASEVMAVVSLSKNLSDLKKKLGNIVVGYTKDGRAITAKDLCASGVMAAILKNALRPNLMQTNEYTPCFVHTGPFANISHGNNSILADMLALSYTDYVITESGFGADCGAEKFFNIKCRYSGLTPSAVIIVCTIRGLKIHSKKFEIIPGKKIAGSFYKENINAVLAGCDNLKKQIENIKLFNLPVIVSINKFKTDTEKEIETVREAAKSFGAYSAIKTDFWKSGSEGGIKLAEAILDTTSNKPQFKQLYSSSLPIHKKIETICKKIYGASKVKFATNAMNKIDSLQKTKWSKLPICMVKTHLSLSCDSTLKGVPDDFTVNIKDVVPFCGAGFISVLCSNIKTMPALPKIPRGTKIDITPDGEIKGL